VRLANRRLRDTGTAAEESRLRLEAFMSNTPAIAFVMDEEGRLVEANHAFRANLGIGSGESPLTAALTEIDRRVLETGVPTEVVETFHNAAGEARKWLTLRFPISRPARRPHLGVMAVDITGRADAERELRFSEERFRVAAGSAADFLFEVDRATDALTFFGDPGERLGIDAGDLPHTLKEWFALVHVDDRERVRAAVLNAASSNQPFAEEGRIVTRRGILHLSARAALLASDPNRWAGTASDITAQKIRQQLFEHQAVHDALTGLPNRRLLDDRLRHALTRAQRESRMLALLFIDLDGFKSVNDSVGHKGGDALLHEAALRLQDTVRQADTLARTGGDEFMLMLEDVKDEASALLVADKVRDRLAAPFETAGRRFMIGASIGISLYPFHGEDAATLERHADAAMYDAKRAGKNTARVYRPHAGVTGLSGAS
jgi:diguanylate cyclase (GGDEF)-like protein